MTLGFSPSTLACWAMRSDELVLPLDDGPDIITMGHLRRFQNIWSAACAYLRSWRASHRLIRSMASPSTMVSLSFSMVSIPIA